VDGLNPLTALPDGNAEIDAREGTAVICELPELPANPLGLKRAEYDGAPDELLPHVVGQNELALLPGQPYDVCVEITLNGNQTQATKNCVKFTYYDQ
jgi:hypothetical protein